MRCSCPGVGRRDTLVSVDLVDTNGVRVSGLTRWRAGHDHDGVAWLGSIEGPDRVVDRVIISSVVATVGATNDSTPHDSVSWRCTAGSGVKTRSGNGCRSAQSRRAVVPVCVNATSTETCVVDPIADGGLRDRRFATHRPEPESRDVVDEALLGSDDDLLHGPDRFRGPVTHRSLAGKHRARRRRRGPRSPRRKPRLGSASEP